MFLTLQLWSENAVELLHDLDNFIQVATPLSHVVGLLKKPLSVKLPSLVAARLLNLFANLKVGL